MTNRSASSDRLGTLTETGEGYQLRYVRHLDRPPSTVWRAFAEPGLVAQWFPSTIDGDLVAGSKLEFEITGMRLAPMVGEVLEADEPHHLVFTWGEDRLSFDLVAVGGGTELTLTVLLGTLGKGARDGAGWHECLDRLAYELDDREPPWKWGERWGEVHDGYVERFGPAAATVGPPG